MPVEHKITLYKVVIRSVIMYGAPIWGAASPTQRLRVQRIQNKFLRLMLRRDRYERIEQMHQDAGLETIDELCTKVIQQFSISIVDL